VTTLPARIGAALALAVGTALLWAVPAQLARCGGYLSILFTGYFERRIRGEMLAYQLDAGQTRRP
jgi:hypothetical protein